MNKYMALGVLTGVIFGLVLVGLLLKFTKKDGSIKCKFDERQALIRGTGFKMSFFTLLVYDAVYGLIGIMIDKQFMDTCTAMIIGICLSVAVYAVYCIWNDAYFSLNENPKRLLVAFGFIAVFNFMIGIINIMNGEVSTNGMLNFRIANFICGILFIVIFIALAARKMKNRVEKE
jgi:hypothetical protein